MNKACAHPSQVVIGYRRFLKKSSGCASTTNAGDTSNSSLPASIAPMQFEGARLHSAVPSIEMIARRAADRSLQVACVSWVMLRKQTAQLQIALCKASIPLSFSTLASTSVCLCGCKGGLAGVSPVAARTVAQTAPFYCPSRRLRLLLTLQSLFGLVEVCEDGGATRIDATYATLSRVTREL